MKHTIEIDVDQCDQITIQNLKEAYRHNCYPQKIDCSDEVIDVDQEFLNAIESVMDYFMNRNEKAQWEIEKAGLVK